MFVKCYLLVIGTVGRFLLETLVLLPRHADLYFSRVRTDTVLNICSLVTTNAFSSSGWVENVGQEENHAKKATQRMMTLKR